MSPASRLNGLRDDFIKDGGCPQGGVLCEELREPAMMRRRGPSTHEPESVNKERKMIELQTGRFIAAPRTASPFLLLQSRGNPQSRAAAAALSLSPICLSQQQTRKDLAP